MYGKTTESQRNEKEPSTISEEKLCKVTDAIYFGIRRNKDIFIGVIKNQAD